MCVVCIYDGKQIIHVNSSFASTHLLPVLVTILSASPQRLRLFEILKNVPDFSLLPPPPSLPRGSLPYQPAGGCNPVYKFMHWPAFPGLNLTQTLDNQDRDSSFSLYSQLFIRRLCLFFSLCPKSCLGTPEQWGKQTYYRPTSGQLLNS